MKIKNLSFIILFIIVISSFASSQEVKKTAEKAKKQELSPKADWFKFKVTSDKKEIIFGEPFFLTLDIDNLTTNSFKLNIASALTNEVVLTISSENGANNRYIGSFDKKLQYFSTAIDMVPQSNACWDYTICYDSERQNGYCFDMTGNYIINTNIRITIEGKDQFIFNAEPIQLKVTEPTGIDKEAFDFIYNKNCALSLHNLSTDANTTPVFEEFLKKFPNSKYAQYIEYSLVFARAGQLDTKKDSKAMCTDSIEGLKAYLQKYPQTSLKYNAMYKIATYEKFLGEKDIAIEYLNKIKKEKPNAPQVNRYDILNYELFYKKSTK